MFQQITESVLDVWIVWAASLAIMSAVLFRGFSGFRWGTLHRFAADEEGAAYTLPYVLTLPIMMLLFCLIIQATLILLVKIGTINAAYAASRSVIVWQSSDPEDASKGSEKRAVLRRTCRSTGDDSVRVRLSASPDTYLFRSLRSVFTTPGISRPRACRFGGSRDYSVCTQVPISVMQESGTEPVGHSPIIRSPSALAKTDYVRNKLLFAGLSTSLEFSESAPSWNADTEVTVKYLMPMHIPGAARAFANGGLTSLFPEYFARELVTTVSLPSEAPETDNGRLGVPYFPAQTQPLLV